MATVKFSKELKATILVNAREVYKQQIEKAVANTKTEWFHTIYNRAYAAYLPHMNALPVEFFIMQDAVSIVKFGGIEMDAVFKLATPLKFPKSNVLNTLLQTNSWRNSELRVIDDNEWGEIADEIYAYKEAINKLVNASEDFTSSVQRIIDSYPTLAPALRAWSPLWELLPAHTKEAHMKVVERVKSEVTLDLDLSKLTSAITMHKLTK